MLEEPLINIGANLASVRDRIGAAARRAGRDADEVALLAVSKRIDRRRIEAALAAGQRALGESRVQEAEDKIPSIGAEVEWHFIGPLQSNKAAMAARLFDVVHSVRRSSLASRLSATAVAAGRNVGVYAQIEPSPGPLPDSAVDEMTALCRTIADADGLKLLGLMTMAPYDPDPERSRPYFETLRRLRDDVVATLPELGPLGLSMGMSGDFEVAIEEGATIVRVGTAIFGARPT